MRILNAQILTNKVILFCRRPNWGLELLWLVCCKYCVVNYHIWCAYSRLQWFYLSSWWHAIVLHDKERACSWRLVFSGNIFRLYFSIFTLLAKSIIFSSIFILLFMLFNYIFVVRVNDVNDDEGKDDVWRQTLGYLQIWLWVFYVLECAN